MGLISKVEISVPVKPKPCPRPRFTVRGKPPKQFVQTYMPEPYQVWKKGFLKILQEEVESEIAPPIFTGPVKLTVRHHTQQPKKTERLYPKGDIDNLCKSVMDAITEHGSIWVDDDQVVELISVKEYSETDLVEIVLEEG